MAIDLSKINLNFNTLEEANVTVRQLLEIIKEHQEQLQEQLRERLKAKLKNASFPSSRNLKKKENKKS